MEFGTALVCDDFNDDGVADLAVGAPGDLEGGSVYVFYGNAERGLSPNNFQKISQAHQNIPSHTRRQEDFGYALTVGDFNDDLAVGDPCEMDTDYLDGDEAGMVIIVRGSSSGIDLNGDVQKISGSATRITSADTSASARHWRPRHL